jgi:hypothetical protein
MTVTRTTREREIRDNYFNRLCGLVGVGGPAHRCFNFTRSLFEIEFRGILGSDSNREEDGKDLRAEYCGEPYTRYVERALEGPCSMLEMLIALAKRIEEMLSTPDKPDRTGIWFWEMIHNLGLREYQDRDSVEKKERNALYNRKIIDRFIERLYNANGDGSLFPQKYPAFDSRTIEIWYQVQAYYMDEYGS